MKEQRTKIICTIGPASASPSKLKKMLYSGMDAARLNFSHGDHKEHELLIENIRVTARSQKKFIPIIQDLQGPKIRIGALSESIHLKKGQRVCFSSNQKLKEIIPIDYVNFHKDVKKGLHILIDDGLLECEITQIKGKRVYAKVLVGGELKERKGVNVPGAIIRQSIFTKKDQEDLRFGLKQNIDWVALSFVSNAADIKIVRQFIKKNSKSSNIPKILAKIERQQAIDHFLEILNSADGILFARGDLGLEIEPEEVPILQKEFADICRLAGKPFIVATHMLNSMTSSPRATRAETSDVANATLDHVDAVMLSQETAIGEYPVKTVATMDLIIKEAENSRLDDLFFYQIHDIPDIESSFAQSLHIMAENGHIKAIVTSLDFGLIARQVNVFRPHAPIYIACKTKEEARQMSLHAGIFPFVMQVGRSTFVQRAESYLRKKKLIKKNDRIAFVLADANRGAQLSIR